MKKYNAILIGNGTMGKRHRVRFEDCGVHFDSVLDLEAEQWIAEHGLKSGEKALPPLDFAVIASPASTHYRYARFFLEHGIPVLVEKPMATTSSEVKTLVSLAKSKGTLLFVAQSECYNPIFLNFRKHLLVDLKRAASVSSSGILDAKLEFRREHGYSERCRDVDVSLDLLVHDISLFLNFVDAKNVKVVGDDHGGNELSKDRVRMALKVTSGEFAGMEAEFIADRNCDRDTRTISVMLGGCDEVPAFDYSVSLARYTSGGEIAHVPDSLDNEHRFFLKLLAGACKDWANRAMENAANAVLFAIGEDSKI